MDTATHDEYIYNIIIKLQHHWPPPQLHTHIDLSLWKTIWSSRSLYECYWSGKLETKEQEGTKLYRGQLLAKHFLDVFSFQSCYSYNCDIRTTHHADKRTASEEVQVKRLIKKQSWIIHNSRDMETT